MAVLPDAATESVRTDTSDPYTFSHTGRAEGSGGVQGVVVTAVQAASTTDHIVGITYGGVALARIVTASDAAGELGRSYLYFVGSGLSGLGGAQTVSVNLASATPEDIHFEAITLTGAADLADIDSDTVSGDAANPAVTLSYTGRTAVAIAALFSGNTGAGVSAGASCTMLDTHAFGTASAHVERQTTPGSSDFTIGFTVSSDDVALVAVAIAESIVVRPSPPTAVGRQAVQRSVTR